MKRDQGVIALLASMMLAGTASGGQAPGAASDPDVPISHHDRVYAAEQFSNTVSVTDPVDNKLLGVIRLVIRSPGISARSTGARFSSMAWAIHPITGRSQWFRSDRMPSSSTRIYVGLG